MALTTTRYCKVLALFLEIEFFLFKRLPKVLFFCVFCALQPLRYPPQEIKAIVFAPPNNSD